MRRIRLTEQELIKLIGHVINEVENINNGNITLQRDEANGPIMPRNYQLADLNNANNQKPANNAPKPTQGRQDSIPQNQNKQGVSQTPPQEPNDSNATVIQNYARPMDMNFTPDQKRKMRKCDTTPMPADKVYGIVIHYTGGFIDQPESLEDVRRYHMNHRKYYDIAYHFLIDLDGTIHKGRDINVENGGTQNKFWNDHSIAICYVGGKDRRLGPYDKKGECEGRDTRTPQQKASMDRLIQALLSKFPNIQDIRGHNQVPNTKYTGCPGFDAYKEYVVDKKYIKHIDPNNPFIKVIKG